jgi:site-specific DNA recombinase
MCAALPAAGAADAALAKKTHEWWAEAAAKAGIDLSGFDPEAPLAKRLAWATQYGLDIATVLSRYSSKMQHSTADQVRDCVTFAAWHKQYPAPEFICVDEATSGRKDRRNGLERVKLILEDRLAHTLLVFKVSRLFRVAYKGFAFFQEQIVDKGLRAVSVSQGIDTTNDKIWKGLAYLHGLMDEMLLDTIADHVRSGLKGLFLAGCVTGALSVGYRPVVIPGAPPTNLGKPRTMPEADPVVASLIRQHFEWIRDGMGIKEGQRRWIEAGGPCDPRSSLGYMSYNAYRRMLSNARYTGFWAFGRKRNRWSSAADYTQQLLQPETDVAIYRCEELRIVDDELFAAVQQRLAEFKLGPRGPKKHRDHQLWDLTTHLFYCAHCNVRFHVTGANAGGMQCKNALCPARSTVRRRDAVRAICCKLTELLSRDTDLIEDIAARAEQIDSQGDESILAEIAGLEKKVACTTARINDLLEMVGQGTDQDRQETKGRLRHAQAQRAEADCELARLRKVLAAHRETITPEAVRAILADLKELLEKGAAGRLGADLVYKALAVFRQLTGGRIDVHVERRAGRKRTTARGVFCPQIIQAIRNRAELAPAGDQPPAEVEVWLRPPPKLDLLAERVHHLMDIAGRSYREAAADLQQEGHSVNSGNVWYMYRRWYAMLGQPVPKLPYNSGRPRRPA